MKETSFVIFGRTFSSNLSEEALHKELECIAYEKRMEIEAVYKHWNKITGTTATITATKIVGLFELTHCFENRKS